MATRTSAVVMPPSLKRPGSQAALFSLGGGHRADSR